MRRLGLALALCAAICSGAVAQIGGLSFPGPGPVVSSGAAYTGPGDITTFVAFYGLRAYSNATIGSNAIQLIRASDSTTQNIVTLAGGGIDTGTWTTFCASTTCKFNTIYDQTGNGHNLAIGSGTNGNASLTGGPGTGAKAVRGIGNGSDFYSVATILETQPTTLYAFANRTGATTAVNTITTCGSDQMMIGMAATANTAQGSAGTPLTAAATDNAWHALLFVANGASSIIAVDGTETTGAGGAQTCSSGSIFFWASTDGTRFTGNWQESGFIAGQPSSTIRSNLATNAAGYW